MKQTYAQEIKEVTKFHEETFDIVKHKLLYDIPDGLSCHEVCRLISIDNDINIDKRLIHCRGKFNGCDHSWLRFSDLTKDGNQIILDPYPWCSGVVNPLMIVNGFPWGGLYKILCEITYGG